MIIMLALAATAAAQTATRASNGAKTNGAKPDAPKLTNVQKRDATLAIKEFRKPDSKESRQEAFKKVVDIGPAAVEMIAPVVDELLAAEFKQYTQTFAGKVREAYVQRLISLTDEQVLQVQKMRRLWHDYAAGRGSRHNFQKLFLKPAWDVAEFLLIKPNEMEDPALAEPRTLVVELVDYQTQCRKALGIEPDPDPTRVKKSPTGLDYPPLDEIPTRLFYLEFLERTVALCAPAPEGAQKVLLMDLESAKEIDVQESEFTLYTNTVRMLIGTVAWYVDPLVCAATRDHSNDRKEGRASGHMSTVPGKHGFTDRLQRMGARWCGSEGAGGGRNGPGYAYSLSYGGGHTGPLYSLSRNVVGVGRRGGCYTSDYATDKSLEHPCAVSLGEMFMPPGTARADVKNPALQSVYNCLFIGDFAKAHSLAASAKIKDDFDKMLLRFFQADVTAEMDWLFEGLAAIEPTGDLYELKRRTDRAMKAFGGIGAFDEKIQPIYEKLGGKKPEKDLATLFEAGKIYQTIARKILDGSFGTVESRNMLQEFLKRYPEGLYAEAAKACLDKKAADKENVEGFDPLTFFRAKADGDALDKYSYYKD